MIPIHTDRSVPLWNRRPSLFAAAFLVLGMVACHKSTPNGTIAPAPSVAEPPPGNPSTAVQPTDAVSRTIDTCGGRLRNGLMLRHPGITNVMVEFSAPLSAAVIKGKGINSQDFTKDSPFANLRIDATNLGVLEAACKDPEVRVLEVLTEYDPHQ